MSSPTVDVEHAWLGLEQQGDGHYRFTVASQLARFDGRLYGGAGLAATIAVLEAETQRRTLWVTVQYVGTTTAVDEPVDCCVEVLSAGYNTTQARVTAMAGDQVILAALGATGRTRENGLDGQFDWRPSVSRPDESPVWKPDVPVPSGSISDRGPFATAEFRLAGCDGSMKLWARMKETFQTRATIAYLADFIPTAVVRAAGRVGAGTSLDNTIRFGPAPAPGTDWVLIDNDPYLADNGYVHGAARIWSFDGTLLAVASQTAAAKLFD